MKENQKNQHANGAKNNLMAQVSQVMRECNNKSYKTRYRYYEAVERFCGYLAEVYHLQKFANIKPKHVVGYVEYLKSQGKSTSYILTDLSGIRFFANRCGITGLPSNSELNLEKRLSGQLDRAWTDDEIKNALLIASNMNRKTVYFAIKMGYLLGLRLEEACRCQYNHCREALDTDQLYVRGKGGQVRYLKIQTAEQRELLKELIAFSTTQGRRGTEKILINSVKGAVMAEKQTIQNWIVNNRFKFIDNTRENLQKNEELKKKALEQGLKLKIETITFHGLRYRFAQDSFKYYSQKGFSEDYCLKAISEALGHHRSEVSKIYLCQR